MEDNVCVEEVALKHITDAVQAQERLSWMVGLKDSTFCDSVKDRCHESLDHLRALKSILDGSHVDFQSPVIHEDAVIELKQLTLMHTPGSLTDDARTKMKMKVEELMTGECKDIVSIILLTCPWYEMSQKERGEQAKHNILLVVFTSFDEQFFSPANPQVKEKASIIDLGWFQAVELSHFGQALAKGRSRFVESVYNRDGAIVFPSEAWKDLQCSLPFRTVTGTRGFIEACLGQATGGISKKAKNGNLKFREGSTVFEVCESLRLMHLAEICFHESSSPSMEITEATLSKKAAEALNLVNTLYEHSNPQACKKEIFDLILTWVKDLRATYQASGRPTSAKATQTEAETVIGQWLMRTRLGGREVQPSSVIEDNHSHLVGLMQSVGGPVSKMSPGQIVLIAVAGSKMYNLDTPTSDVDYTVVYMSDTQKLLSATNRQQESFENKGLDKMVEYGVLELRAFAETLLKCSVTSLELVYATTKHDYANPLWEELSKERRLFVTEKAIQQYIGLIKNNFKFIERGKNADDPKRERKLFYKIFHKIHSLEDMMHGRVPEVRLEGDIREFVMNVRTQFEGEWSRENILTKARQGYTEMREKLCQRTQRLKENTDYAFVTSWLMRARSLSTETNFCLSKR